jgi:hypothetical protein
LRCPRDVLEGARFEDFQLQAPGLGVRMRREDGAQPVDEIGLLHLPGADVDADRRVESGGAPSGALPQGGADDPLADFDGQRMVLDDG